MNLSTSAVDTRLLPLMSILSKISLVWPSRSALAAVIASVSIDLPAEAPAPMFLLDFETERAVQHGGTNHDRTNRIQGV